MTMPNERFRSLRWAHELLAEIDSDPEVSEDLRARARSLAVNFPTPDALLWLISSDAKRLPRPFAEAIELAHDLFLDIQLGARGSSATRKSVLYTLRHYPPVGTAAGLAKGGFALGIESWVAKDTEK